jgi:hypothetical protein
METLSSPTAVIPVFSKKCEPYSKTPDGHFVGNDGFVVPKTFAEFYEREPFSVRRFLMKKLHRQMVDEVILDLEQDLLLHLHYLPEKSKHRKQGKTDIIMCFDPEKHHGASAKRFHNYLALCMNNRFCTILHKQKKNPIYNKTNLSICPMPNSGNDGTSGLQAGECTDEFIHNNSASISSKARANDGEANLKKIFISEFKAYTEKHAPEILPVIEAIADSNSLKDARLVLGVSGRTFDKQREMLDLLQDCFLRGEDFTTAKNAAKNRRSTRIRSVRETKKTKKLRRETTLV